MKRFICAAALSCSLLCVHAQPRNTPGTKAKSTLRYVVIPAAHGTFGYDIFQNGKLLIHQPTVPGLAGDGGFRSKPAATRIAQLVVEKIRRGEMPPTITPEELRLHQAL